MSESSLPLQFWVDFASQRFTLARSPLLDGVPVMFAFTVIKKKKKESAPACPSRKTKDSDWISLASRAPTTAGHVKKRRRRFSSFLFFLRVNGRETIKTTKRSHDSHSSKKTISHKLSDPSFFNNNNEKKKKRGKMTVKGRTQKRKKREEVAIGKKKKKRSVKTATIRELVYDLSLFLLHLRVRLFRRSR